MIKGNQKLLNVIRFIIDVLILIVSFVLAYLLRFDEEFSFLIRYGIIDEPIGLYEKLEQYMQLLFLLIPCYLLSYYIFHLYDPKRVTSRKSQIYNIFKANVIGILYCTAGLYFIKRSGNYARLFIIIFVVINFILELFFRLLITTILRRFRKKGHNLKHILLVGYGRSAEGYIDRICAHPEWGYVVHGILDDRKRNGKSYRDVHVIGDIDDLESIIANNSYDEIAITLGIDQYGRLEDIVSITEKSGVHTKFIPDYNNIIPTKPYTEDLDGLPVIHVRNVPLSNSFNKFVKRSIDIVGSLVGIIVFSIPMLIVAIIVKATSEGPLIFQQERIGLHGKPFMMYKFRSMTVQKASEEKKAWTTPDDPRVTPIGKFIRKT